MWLNCTLDKATQYPGDSFVATITVRNVSRQPIEVELISAQLHGDFLLNSIFASEQYAFPIVRRPPQSTSLPDVIDLGSRGFSIYATEPALIDCNHIFQPSEEKIFFFQATLPKHIPPSYSGQLALIRHVLTIGTLRPQRPVMTSNISIVVVSPESAVIKTELLRNTNNEKLIPAKVVLNQNSETADGDDKKQKYAEQHDKEEDEDDEEENNWWNQYGIDDEEENEEDDEEQINNKGNEIEDQQSLEEKQEMNEVTRLMSIYRTQLLSSLRPTDLLLKGTCPDPNEEDQLKLQQLYSQKDQQSLKDTKQTKFNNKNVKQTEVLSPNQPKQQENDADSNRPTIAVCHLSSTLLHQGRVIDGYLEFARDSGTHQFQTTLLSVSYQLRIHIIELQNPITANPNLKKKKKIITIILIQLLLTATGSQFQ
ncbi:MAG: hypothetical protein EZS28_015943 [Streblomastix strix]|uniref:Uncharacterized protein n=1 Tax=Streblomastix strix TaxID=222440 RepID=A0A5J4W161_9EUKA|nr:MAG: hypothetical protein EZS28_015943 [Streblomastix strix]